MRKLPILITIFVVSITNTSLAELIFKKAGDQVIITSKLERDDHYRFTEFMENHKDIKTVILRNFPGGNYDEMDFIGDYILKNKLNTAVSGYCNSACAVIFLHGKKRQFTRDFSGLITNVAFHNCSYRFSADSPDSEACDDGFGQLGSFWKKRFLQLSGGKFDEVAWKLLTSVSGSGYVRYYHPRNKFLQKFYKHHQFVCPKNPYNKISKKHHQNSDLNYRKLLQEEYFEECERVEKDALETGVITTLDYIKSNDFQEFNHQKFTKRGINYGQVSDLISKTLIPQRWFKHIRNYTKRRLQTKKYGAIAIGVERSQIRYTTTMFPNQSIVAARSRCESRVSGPCLIIAVDNTLVVSPEKIKRIQKSLDNL